MTTPVCNVCGDHFPGDPCKKCGAPAGLSKEDAQGYKRMKLVDQGMTRRQVKSAMRTKNSASSKRRRKHGRHV